MKWNRRPRTCPTTGALLLLAVTATIAAPNTPLRFKLHELSLGGSNSRVSTIKNGRAVGEADLVGDQQTHAYVWSEAHGMRDLGTLGGTRSGAAAIDGDRVVGFSLTAGDAEGHAFSWTPATGMVDLGTLGGDFSAAHSVSGDAVAGISKTASGDIHAFRWTPQAGMVDLGTAGEGTESSAEGIHRRLIAGWSATNGNLARTPVAWDASNQLITLTGPDLLQGQAVDVHEGLVVGYFRPQFDGLLRAFAWRAEHGLRDLGVPISFDESYATATNGRHVVGGLMGFLVRHPFIWSAATGIVDLGTLGGESEATAVNHDTVVGWFVLQDVGFHTFLWTRSSGMHDVTPRSFTNGARPMAIDAEGRIAIMYEDDFSARSGVLVPRRH